MGLGLLLPVHVEPAGFQRALEISRNMYTVVLTTLALTSWPEATEALLQIKHGVNRGRR